MPPTSNRALRRSSISSVWRRFARWTARSATNRTIVVLFALGVLLRVLVMGLYSSVVLIFNGGDSSRYLRLPFTGYHGVFSDPGMPAGYPAFLDVARALSHDIVFTIGLQHLMGLATAACVLLIVRRVGAPLWLGLIPAGVVLLSGDMLFLETALLTETLWMFLMSAGLWAAMTARESDHAYRWLAGGGALLAFASIVRNVTLPLAIMVAIWAVWELAGPWKARVRAAAAVLLPFIMIVAAYIAVANIEHGYPGFTNLGGFNLYSRVGQFANCKDFTPPKGTAALCNDPTPPNEREGPTFYAFSPDSPLHRAGFSVDPASAVLLGRFARAAIIHQPFEYLKAVAKDLLRYIAPYAAGARPESGISPGGMSFASASPSNQGQTPPVLASEFSQDYTDVGRGLPTQTVRELLGSYQEVFRLGGLPVIVLTILAIMGLFVSEGSVRRALLLFFVIAVYLYVVPVALSSYDVRYGVPASLLLSIAGALGGWSIWTRLTRSTAERQMQPVDYVGV